MIKLEKKWVYEGSELLQTENIDEVISLLLSECRSYYNAVGMDNPQYIIKYHSVELVLDCDIDFHRLNTDEKVINHIKEWYHKQLPSVSTRRKVPLCRTYAYGLDAESLKEKIYGKQ